MRAGIACADEPRDFRFLIRVFTEKSEGLPTRYDIRNKTFGYFRFTGAFGMGIPGKHGKRFGLVTESVLQISIGAYLETVHLVPPAEVHFAYQTGPVSMCRKMSRPGNVFRKQYPVVVPCRTVVYVFTGEQTHP